VCLQWVTHLKLTLLGCPLRCGDCTHDTPRAPQDSSAPAVTKYPGRTVCGFRRDSWLSLEALRGDEESRNVLRFPKGRRFAAFWRKGGTKKSAEFLLV
jgi:hypothetical protein